MTPNPTETNAVRNPILPLAATMVAICCSLPSCSKTEAQAITDVLNKCAAVSKNAGKYNTPAEQANFIVKSFQGIDMKGCPADFRMAYQAHVNAWQEASNAFALNTAGNAFIEGVAAGLTQDPGYIGQASQQAAYASQQVNATYYTLTEIAAKYGARIPRSVVGQ